MTSQSAGMQHKASPRAGVLRSHEWLDEDGSLVFAHEKYRSGGWGYWHPVDGPSCPEHHDPEAIRKRRGGYVCKRKPAKADSMLWDMPRLAKVRANGGDVLWTAGEKDALSVAAALAEADVPEDAAVATSMHQGEGHPVTEGQLALLDGFTGKVILYYDRDDTGVPDVLDRAGSLRKREIKYVIKGISGDLIIPKGELPNDISDYLTAGGELGKLKEIGEDKLRAALEAARPNGTRKRTRRTEPGGAGPAEDAAGEEVGEQLAAFLEALRAANPDLRVRHAGDRTYYTCPLPDHEDRDPSFNVMPGRGGGLVLACSCPGGMDGGEEHTEWTSSVLEELGLDWDAVAPRDGGDGAGRPLLNVSNAADCADWLRDNLGAGRLAGMFMRGQEIVHVPRIGEDGYIPLTDQESGDDDGPAQIRAAGPDYIASRVFYNWRCYRVQTYRGEVVKGKNGKPRKSHADFPVRAAKIAWNAPDLMTNLRRLRGVTHTPVVRDDGTILDQPGHDPATRLLYLPDPGLSVPPVPLRPSDGDLDKAADLLLELVCDFPFISDHHLANYLGALITPLVREIVPPPYKQIPIGAHQPGSGKTLLATLPRIIHGGVFRSEFPGTEEELRKQITSILSITTAPVVVFDNVTGTLRSSVLAGLLTSGVWGDRPLQVTGWADCRNDRLWMLTGNNLSIGGDLPRRSLEVLIDPGAPHPEQRTGFRHPKLKSWAAGRRGNLLSASLTLVRGWHAAGRPLLPERTSDDYSQWLRIVGGILGNAGIPGQFGHPSTQPETGGDEQEWGAFLAAVRGAFGRKPWTVRELIEAIDPDKISMDGEAARLSLDDLPGELAAKAEKSPAGLSRSLGKWLTNRVGRWEGTPERLAVVHAGIEPHGKAGLWRVIAPGEQRRRADQ